LNFFPSSSFSSSSMEVLNERREKKIQRTYTHATKEKEKKAWVLLNIKEY